MLITLTTDFGVGGRYVAQLKGVLYRHAPGAAVVDLSHNVPPQDVAHAARLLEQATPWYPERSVHLAVVDPGVGTDRPIVALSAEGRFYVGPDNGLFGWLAGRVDEAVALSAEALGVGSPSATFHGRDLMAPAVARLAAGAELAELGPPHEGLVTLPAAPAPERTEDRVVGRVVEVDRYGNLITNVRPEDLGDAPTDERLRVTLGEHETFGLWRTYADQPPQTLLALVGSEGQIELAITQGSAAAMLFAGVGAAVTLDWEPRIDANGREEH